MMCAVGLLGIKKKRDVDGGCLDSVMSVQTSRMWCLRGARSLGLRHGRCEVSNLPKPVGEEGQLMGDGDGENERGQSRGGEREGVCPFGSDKHLHLTSYITPGKTWLGLWVDDNRLQRFFFSSALLKRLKTAFTKIMLTV